MASYVDIANLAVGYLGEDDQLRSPDDDSHVGRTVKAVWDIVRRAALRDHPWNFALRRTALTPQALDAAPIGWGYSYPMPAGSLRLVDVYGCGKRDYAQEGGAILTNAGSPLQIRYIADVSEPSYWDDLFVEAFARRLGFQIADRITGDRGRKTDAWNAYKEALSNAKRVDALENPHIRNNAPTPWEIARGPTYGDADYSYVDRNGLLFP